MVVTESQQIAIRRAALLSSRTGTNNKSARQETSPPRDANNCLSEGCSPEQPKKIRFVKRRALREQPKKISVRRETSPPRDANNCLSEGCSPEQPKKNSVRQETNPPRAAEKNFGSSGDEPSESSRKRNRRIGDAP